MRRSRNVRRISKKVVRRTKRMNTRKRTPKRILRRSRRVKGVINRRKRNMNNVKNTVTKKKMRSRQKSKSKKIKRKILKGETLKRLKGGGNLSVTFDEKGVLESPVNTKPSNWFCGRGTNLQRDTS